MTVCPDCAEPIRAAEPRCDSCGWSGRLVDGIPVYLSSADQKNPLWSTYSANYERISEDDLEEDILDQEFVQNRALNLADMIGDARGAAACDVGCGRGYLTRALVERGVASVVSVDVSMAYLHGLGGDARVTPMLANAECLPFVGEFDLIVSTDVMEHVLNVGSYLLSINRALRPGGRLFLRVPYLESLLPYARQAGCPYEFVHLRSFDRRILRLYLAAAGFDVRRTRLDGFWPRTPQPFWLGTDLLRRFYGRGLEPFARRYWTEGALTRWPPSIARLFMRPSDLIAEARKVREPDV